MTREEFESNNIKAGYDVYSLSNNTIDISDASNLTWYEKYAILMTHTATVTFNSFAAEVEYHANVLLSLLSISDDIYEHALRADMAMGEEADSGFTDQYYDLNSSIVRAQIDIHGEY